jgi:hypothetical protein
MMKIASLKEIQLGSALVGHLLLLRLQGEKLAILVHGPQPQPAPGLITLSPSPMLRWLQPRALDAICVDLGAVELVFAPKLEAFSSGPQHYVPGALIIETEGAALICSDANGMEARIGISDWRLRTSPLQGSSFYIREWQLGLPGAIVNDMLDIVYTQKPPGPGP